MRKSLLMVCALLVPAAMGANVDGSDPVVSETHNMRWSLANTGSAIFMDQATLVERNETYVKLTAAAGEAECILVDGEWTGHVTFRFVTVDCTDVRFGHEYVYVLGGNPPERPFIEVYTLDFIG